MSRSMWVSGCSFDKDEHKYFPQCHLSRVACSPPPIPPLAHKKPPVPYPSFSRLVHLPQLTTSCLHLWGFLFIHSQLFQTLFRWHELFKLQLFPNSIESVLPSHIQKLFCKLLRISKDICNCK